MEHPSYGPLSRLSHHDQEHILCGNSLVEYLAKQVQIPVVPISAFGPSSTRLGGGSFGQVLLYGQPRQELRKYGLLGRVYVIKSSIPYQGQQRAEHPLMPDLVLEMIAGYYIVSDHVAKPRALAYGPAGYGLVFDQAYSDLHRAMKTRLKEPEKISLIADIAEGLMMAHRANIIHRDLKPGNILVFQSGGQLEARVSDFGSAFNNFCDRYPNQLATTLNYRAPEAMSGSEQSSQTALYDDKVDVWSFGIVVAEMWLRSKSGGPVLLFDGNTEAEYWTSVVKLLGDPRLSGAQEYLSQMPWWNRPEFQAPMTGKQGDIVTRLQDLPRTMFQLVVACLQYDPYNRPSMEQIFGQLVPNETEPCLLDCIDKLMLREMGRITWDIFDENVTYHLEQIDWIWQNYKFRLSNNDLFLVQYYLSRLGRRAFEQLDDASKGAMLMAALYLATLVMNGSSEFARRGTLSYELATTLAEADIGPSLTTLMTALGGSVAPATAYEFLLAKKGDVSPDDMNWYIKCLQILVLAGLSLDYDASYVTMLLFHRMPADVRLIRERLLPLKDNERFWQLMDTSYEAVVEFLD